MNNNKRGDKIKSKGGVSPVIATVLLIAIVVVMALIIFIWFKTIVTDKTMKFDQNIEIVCDDVSISASYSQESNNLAISNDGTIPINGMKIQIFTEGGHDTEDLEGFEGLGQGEAGEYTITIEGDIEKIVLIPVLLGISDNEGEKTFVCNNNEFEAIIE